MSLNYIQGNVAVTDPTSGQGGPFPTSNVKDVLTKVIKINPANFNTTRVDTLVAVLPADASIIGIFQYIKVALTGGGITSATMRVGTTSGGQEILGDGTWPFGSTGAYTALNGGSGLGSLCANYNMPPGQDIRIYAGGAAVTGNPTAGELYLIIQYIR